MTYEEKLLAAIDASKLTPEEFGETLLMASTWIDLDDTQNREAQITAQI